MAGQAVKPENVINGQYTFGPAGQQYTAQRQPDRTWNVYNSMGELLQSEPSIEIAVRRTYANHGLVTLDGKPAVVSGVKCDFAFVAPLRGGAGCEFAWSTVAHVIDNKNGKFKS